MFANTSVNISTRTRVYGSIIGQAAACGAFSENKANEYGKLLTKIANAAKKSPQRAYACLVHAIQNKRTFLLRTTPNFTVSVTITERIIRSKVITSLTGQDELSDSERSLPSLPTRDGGLNITE